MDGRTNGTRPDKLYFSDDVQIYVCPKDATNSPVTERPANGLGYGFFKCAGIERKVEQYIPCSFTTDDRKAFADHVRQHHSYMKLMCLYCSDVDRFGEVKFFDTVFMLTMHVEKRHKYSAFHCNMCPYRAITPDHVNVHQSFWHLFCSQKVIVRCPPPVLKPRFMLKYFFDCYRVHQRVTQQYQCLYCYEAKSDFQDLILHMVKRHPDYPLLYYPPLAKSSPTGGQIEVILLTDDEQDDDFMSEDDEENIENASGATETRYCCFFCDERFARTAPLQAHLLKHLFASKYRPRNAFFDNWINWYISAQHSYARPQNQSCGICAKLAGTTVNGHQPWTKNARQRNDAHFLMHAGFKTVKCLLCRTDFWLPNLFGMITNHLRQFHRDHLARINLNVNRFRSMPHRDVLDMMKQQSVIMEYCTENRELLAMLDKDNQQALELLETAYQKNLRWNNPQQHQPQSVDQRPKPNMSK